jgi:hypothetical protein
VGASPEQLLDRFVYAPHGREREGDSPTLETPAEREVLYVNEAKPTRSEKVEVRVDIQFSRWGKTADVSAAIHRGFFPVLKIEEQPKIRFRSREGFCLASLRMNHPLT